MFVFGIFMEQLIFSEVSVMANDVVSAADVERYRIERAAEIVVFGELREVVARFATKVSPRNRVLKSLRRMITAHENT